MVEKEEARVTFLIPKDMLDEVDQIAADSKVSRSWVIRAAIEEYLNAPIEE